MTTHPLVHQLHFARSEFQRGLAGVSDEESVKRIQPMNSLGWMVGHLANQESRWWVLLAQREDLLPELNEIAGFGKPASTPPIAEMWEAWQTVTCVADRYLSTVTVETLQDHFIWKGKPRPESIGTMLIRCIYHYWYHIGESSAIRQMLGHTDLPVFIGDMTGYIYQPEKQVEQGS